MLLKKKENPYQLLIPGVEKLLKEEDVSKAKMLKTVFSQISKPKELNSVPEHLKYIIFLTTTFVLIKEDSLNVQDTLSSIKMNVTLNV